jgi:hypothetical protein
MSRACQDEVAVAVKKIEFELFDLAKETERMLDQNELNMSVAQL